MSSFDGLKNGLGKKKINVFQSTKILACDFHLVWKSKLCKSPCLSIATCLLFISARTPLLVYANIILPNANTLTWPVAETGLSSWDSMFQTNHSDHWTYSVGYVPQNFTQGLICCLYFLQANTPCSKLLSYSHFVLLLYALKQIRNCNINPISSQDTYFREVETKGLDTRQVPAL